ncbi:MAG: hypothetical protein D6806_11375 [Deltaproteobacteria bacterium]|nr:MAG: hypothetical protein D6806_11375 [Deltaproteobacteria bacterium]
MPPEKVQPEIVDSLVQEIDQAASWLLEQQRPPDRHDLLRRLYTLQEAALVAGYERAASSLAELARMCERGQASEPRMLASVLQRYASILGQLQQHSASGVMEILEGAARLERMMASTETLVTRRTAVSAPADLSSLARRLNDSARNHGLIQKLGQCRSESQLLLERLFRLLEDASRVSSSLLIFKLRQACRRFCAGMARPVLLRTDGRQPRLPRDLMNPLEAASTWLLGEIVKNLRNKMGEHPAVTHVVLRLDARGGTVRLTVDAGTKRLEKPPDIPAGVEKRLRALGARVCVDQGDAGRVVLCAPAVSGPVRVVRVEGKGASGLLPLASIVSFKEIGGASGGGLVVWNGTEKTELEAEIASIPFWVLARPRRAEDPADVAARTLTVEGEGDKIMNPLAMAKLREGSVCWYP